MNTDSLMHVLEHHAQAQPHKTAFNYIGRNCGELQRLTFAELKNISKNLAREIATVPGTRGPALLLFNQSLDFIVSFMACLYAGVVAIPVSVPSHNKGYRRLAAIMQDAHVDLVLTHSPVLSTLSPDLMNEFFQQVDILPVDQIGWSALRRDHSGTWTRPPQDLAFLQYTSGSTGTPKGVMVTHQNIIANERMIQEAFAVDHRDVAVSWLPTFHDMGLIGGVMGSIFVGTTTHLMSPQDFIRNPLSWLRAITEHRATITGGPNFGYDLCVQRIRDSQLQDIDLSSWRVAYNGAEPIKGRTLNRFSERFADSGFDSLAHTPCYGLAETTLMVAAKAPAGVVNRYSPKTLLCDNGDTSWVGCGRPASGQTIVIANRDGEQAQPGEVGEIWIHGPHVAAGYWNRKEETAATFGATLKNAPQYAGVNFLRTGDLGVFCGDEIVVTGRCKDLIILRGRNIYPQDVEQLVEDVAGASLRPGSTVAVANANCSGMVVMAELRNSRVTPEEQESLTRNLCQAITEFFNAIPDQILLLEKNSIPKTTSGKLQRALARKIHLPELQAGEA